MVGLEVLADCDLNITDVATDVADDIGTTSVVTVPRKIPTFVMRPKPHRDPENRPSAHRRGYGRNWRKLRLQILAEEPLCRTCRESGKVEPAEHVDHNVPLEAGGTNDRDNLVPLCHSCHSKKTVAQDGGLGNAKVEHG